jgi:hypothetical protein
MNQPGTHKLTEALEGQEPADISQTGPSSPSEPPKPGSTPHEVAEATRREQEARSHGRPDRDDYLTNMGRGDQTHG